MKLKKTAMLVAVLGMSAGLFADWSYDPGAGVIIDSAGDWKFAVTATGTELTVGQRMSYPSHRLIDATPLVLDFSLPVVDGDGTNYTIVAIDTKYGYTTDPEGRYIASKVMCASADRILIGELVLPTTLRKIGVCAFAGCENLSKVTPFLPDSVTEVGEGAFCKTQVAGDLRLYGVTRLFDGVAFGSTKITSVTFGPSLYALECVGEDSAPFYGVTTVTNLVFDPECSGVRIHPYALSMPSTLTAPLKLRGVASLGDWALANLRFERVEFDDGITSIGAANTFKGNTLLAYAVFRGKPPTVFDLTYAGAAQKVTTCCRRRFFDAWKDLAEGGVINMKTSAFTEALCATYSTTTALRPLRYVDKADGFVLGYR